MKCRSLSKCLNGHQDQSLRKPGCTYSFTLTTRVIRKKVWKALQVDVESLINKPDFCFDQVDELTIKACSISPLSDCHIVHSGIA